MSAERLSRDQFQARLTPLDDALRKLLWTLYWRGRRRDPPTHRD